LYKKPDGTLVVVDYKVSKEKSQEYVDENFQLSLYTFAIKKERNYKGEDIELHMHFLGNKEQKIVVSKRTPKDIEKLRQRVIQVKQGIENNVFEPKQGEKCRYCLYECPLGINKKEREEYLQIIEEKRNKMSVK
jgi:hypothetical protein